MKYLGILAVVLACSSCAVGVRGSTSGEVDVVPLESLQATMKPTKNELDPQPVYACVTVNQGNETYTVDPSGKVHV